VEAIYALLPSVAAYQLPRAVATISPLTAAIMYPSLISIMSGLSSGDALAVPASQRVAAGQGRSLLFDVTFRVGRVARG
jgi:hypothetical protein